MFGLTRKTPKPARKQKAAKIGCGFLIGTGVVIVGLLIINGLFVRLFFSLNLTGIDDRLFQAGQFVLPIIMIFIEFWFYDMWKYRRHRR